MAWTAPATWTTGQVVTAAELNEQIKDNETYLKGQTDRLDTLTQSVVTGSRGFNTTYQNTSGKPMWVTVSVSMSGSDVGDGNCAATVLTDAAATPTTVVGSVACVKTFALNDVEHKAVAFCVSPGNYYRITSVVSGVGVNMLAYWTEWTL